MYYPNQFHPLSGWILTIDIILNARNKCLQWYYNTNQLWGPHFRYQVIKQAAITNHDEFVLRASEEIKSTILRPYSGCLRPVWLRKTLEFVWRGRNPICIKLNRTSRFSGLFSPSPNPPHQGRGITLAIKTPLRWWEGTGDGSITPRNIIIFYLAWCIWGVTPP